MIDEASIIPYNNNWRQQRINPTQINPQIDFKGEFESSLFYHLQMILNDGGDVDEKIIENDGLLKSDNSFKKGSHIVFSFI